MKRKVVVVFLIICLFGSIGILFTIEELCNMKEDDVLLFSVTVRDIQYSGHEKERNVTIYTEEFNNRFMVFSIVPKELIEKVFQSIHIGDSIKIQITGDDAEILNSDAFIDIVSLEKDDIVIYSLMDYNLYMQKAFVKPRIACIVWIIFLVITSTIFIFRKGQIKAISNRISH